MTLLALALAAQLAQTRTAHVEHLKVDVPEVGTVTYGLAVPGDYDASRPRPLVLTLHPGGSGAYYGSWYMESIVIPALKQLDAIMIAPDCPGRGWAEAKSERAVLALVDKIFSDYSIDRRRVLVTGYSMGGRGTWFFSSHHADLFTGAIAMAASTGDEPVDRLGRIPTYIIHSRDDQVSPFAPAERNARQLESLGRPVTFEALRGLTHFEMGGYIESLTRAGRWIAARWNSRAE